MEISHSVEELLSPAKDERSSLWEAAYAGLQTVHAEAKSFIDYSKKGLNDLSTSTLGRELLSTTGGESKSNTSENEGSRVPWRNCRQVQAVWIPAWQTLPSTPH